MSITKGFHHVALKVPDFDAAIAFYRDLLGFGEKVFVPGQMAMLDAGDNVCVELFPGGEALTANNGYYHVAYAVENVDAVVEKVRAAGFPITIEPKDVNVGGNLPSRIAFCQGPAGEQVEFFCEL